MRPLYLLLTVTCSYVMSDTIRTSPDDISALAPNSVPMMGKRRPLRLPKYFYQRSFVPIPMLRLKKEERESPFIYKTPWHIGKRGQMKRSDEEVKRSAASSGDVKRMIPDVFTAQWIGSLFKPGSEDRNNRFLKPSSLKGLV